MSHQGPRRLGISYVMGSVSHPNSRTIRSEYLCHSQSLADYELEDVDDP